LFSNPGSWLQNSIVLQRAIVQRALLADVFEGSMVQNAPHFASAHALRVAELVSVAKLVSDISRPSHNIPVAADMAQHDMARHAATAVSKPNFSQNRGIF
jgi:hypothetical protein